MSFEVGVFCSPLIVAAFWSYAPTIRCMDNITQSPFSFPGMTPLRRLYRRIMGPDVTCGGRYTAPCRAIVGNWYLAEQSLHDDILYLIATYDYQIYGSMLMVNKSLNAMLRNFDPWSAFVEIIETRSVEDYGNGPRIFECIKMQIKGTQEYMLGEPRGALYHGEMIETITTDRRHGNWSKRETHRHYRFNYEYKTEIYVYNRIRDQAAGRYNEYKWKSYECIHTPATRERKHKYKVERIFNELGGVKETQHYRDGILYSPSGEVLETVCMVITCSAVCALIGYSIWADWPHITAKLRVYLSGDVKTLCADIKRFFDEMDSRMEARGYGKPK